MSIVSHISQILVLSYFFLSTYFICLTIVLFPDSPAPEEDSNQFSIAVIALIHFLLHIPLLFQSLLLVRFLMFLNKVFYAYQGCIYLIKYTLKTVILWNYYNLK